MNNLVSSNSNKALVDNDLFAPAPEADDLGAGIQSGFPVMSLRGAKFHVKVSGDEETLVNSEGDPRSALEVVILQAADRVENTYFEGAWEPGSTDSPVCYSRDGVKPDADAPEPQSRLCANCPKAQMGSAITDDGRKSRACRGGKPMAIALADDIKGDTYGGPIMLRVKAGSFAELKAYGAKVQKAGFSYRAIVTKLGFDTQASFPKLTFKPHRPLTEDEKAQVIAVHPDAAAMLETAPVEGADVPATEPDAPVPETPAPAPIPEPEPEEPETDEDEGGGFFGGEAPVEAPPEPEARPKKKAASKKAGKKKAAAKKPEPVETEAPEADDTMADLDDFVASFEL